MMVKFHHEDDYGRKLKNVLSVNQLLYIACFALDGEIGTKSFMKDACKFITKYGGQGSPGFNVLPL